MDDVLACATACTGNFTVPIGICTNTRARQPKHGGLSFVWYKSRAVSSPIQWMMYWPARLHVPEIFPFASRAGPGSALLQLTACSTKHSACPLPRGLDISAFALLLA